MANKRFIPLLLCLLLFSCGKKDQIRQYRVAKENSSSPSVSQSASSAGGQIWFFKLVTKSDAFNEYSNEFAKMIISADFSKGIPEYELPTGWKSKDGPPPVYQTIEVTQNENEAALTVMPLPAPASDPTGYLKSNVDRWRRQLGMPPSTSSNWLADAMDSSEIISIPNSQGKFITLVHLEGSTEKMSETKMLVAMVSNESLTGNAAMSAAPPSASTASPRKSSNVAYDLPEGWRESPGNSMRLVSLAVDHEAGTSEISVIRLPGGGDVLPNINRWRGQVKLDPVDTEELKASLEEIKVDGQSGNLTFLEGPEQSILAAIVEKDGVKWFYKMQGPTPAVKAEQAHFREFLKSVKIKNDSE